MARYLCSQLVALRYGNRRITVNLEEIWDSGAILEAEEPVEPGGHAELDCGSGIRLCGVLKSTQAHAFGWCLEMEFSPLTPWSPERFRPEHMLDPSNLR